MTSAAATAGQAADIVLRVSNLTVEYTTRRGPVRAVRDVSYSIARGGPLESSENRARAEHAGVRGDGLSRPMHA
jgi:hypothetical protein